LIPSLTHREVVLGFWDTAPPDGKARLEAPGYAPREIEVVGGMAATAPVVPSR